MHFLRWRIIMTSSGAVVLGRDETLTSITAIRLNTGASSQRSCSFCSNEPSALMVLSEAMTDRSALGICIRRYCVRRGKVAPASTDVHARVDAEDWKAVKRLPSPSDNECTFGGKESVSLASTGFRPTKRSLRLRIRAAPAQNVALPTNTACRALDLQRIFRPARAPSESKKLHPQQTGRAHGKCQRSAEQGGCSPRLQGEFD
jgi:hypothetical protein